MLGLDPDKKTVLYAPTWRGNKGSARFDAEQLEKDIDSLTKLNANVVFQAHHIMLRHIKDVDYGSIIVPPPSVVTNELLAVVDLLISDYSSIFFDFLATGKPIVHYLYDYDAYAEERGLLLDKSELPGPIVTTSDELVAEVNHLTADMYTPDEKYRRAQAKFAPHDDGHASDRTIRWFLQEDTSETNLIETRKRPSIIFWGGRLDKSKKTRDFLESVRIAAEAGDKDVTLFVAHSVKSNEAAMEQIRKLGLSVSVVARNDYEMAMTTAERHARNPEEASEVAPQSQRPTPFWKRLTSAFRRTQDADEGLDSLLSEMYKREYRRVFGDSQFDELVMFPGASHFWKKLAEHARR
ncbi:CDP-Glycerol:Poly(glycerophosphate) glycerophosphotransferase [Brevibacterium linens ATCC 9172]|uniref:CDP-Glycerol:Poly(Glycerophosphate) glycerophosphotransferase n=1 Tax=Brevibacterium linens ATCC 9172 TaxID=1255617 RepID=A0A2H1KS12_BRELN|nr:CDP-glycerol glycerophosphotransferase family protein [Brevibacterium linens]SMY02439.1 CDP-Glycerol:Poly(glycerophosphate) glycerophosphotransferase [Brevibacterium linens ATCC 9172]